MKARTNRHRSETNTVLKITEEGALFRSYRDGRKVLLTPESSVQAQKGKVSCMNMYAVIDPRAKRCVPFSFLSLMLCQIRRMNCLGLSFTFDIAYGSDIIIPLDELHPYHIDRDTLIKCVLRSHRWEARSLSEHLKDVQQQAMYAVIHGGVDRSVYTFVCRCRHACRQV